MCPPLSCGLLVGWALAVSMSRSFRLSSISSHTMVPLIDMANHSWTSNAEIRSDADGMVRMMANKEVGGEGVGGAACYGGGEERQEKLGTGDVGWGRIGGCWLTRR